MSRFFTFSFFLFPFYFLILINFSPNKIHAQSSFDFILVQVPALINSDSLAMINEYTPMDRYTKNTRIIRLSSTSNQSINLTADFYAAADPDISFDGTSIIFAGKKEVADRWQIWQMKHDGSEKIQITKSNGDCFMPVHAGSRFYLNDPQPTPQIIYAGTVHKWRNFKENWPVLSLYGTDPEGKKTNRLTFNLYSDFSPDILPDGRIVYSSWQESRAGGKFALMGLNNDGTDLMSYYGNHEPPIFKNMIHISDTDHRVYFIESDFSSWLGGGDIASLSQQRPLKSYKKLTKLHDDLYHSPCPTHDGGLLSSYRTNSINDVFSLYRIDPNSGEKEDLIYKEQGWHSIDVQVLTAHPQVKGRSNWLIPGAVNGVFYCMDSYNTNNSENKKVEKGSIKYLRVLEGLPLSEKDIQVIARVDSKNKGVKTMSPRRILGVAPVEKDGSFHIRVPAETPVNFQLLDENYMTVKKQDAWTWVIGNENRGCIGCHEDRELSPPNILVEAVTKPAVDLTLSPEKWKTVDFQHQIIPLIKAKCATENCHIDGKVSPNFSQKQASDKIASSRQIYKLLLKTIDGTEDKEFIEPGNASESSLIWHILGKQVPSENTSLTKNILPLSPGERLTEEEEILFIEWIDTGAFWDLSPLKIHGSQEY